MMRSCAFDPLSRIRILALAVALSACASAPVFAPAEAARPVALRQVPAASGAKFEAECDPTTVFWSKGNRAAVTVRGAACPGCRTVAIGSQTLRAFGNEPGWRREAYGPNLRCSADEAGAALPGSAGGGAALRVHRRRRAGADRFGRKSGRGQESDIG